MKEKYLYVTSVEELATQIVQNLKFEKIQENDIPTIDFCTVDVERKLFYSDAELQQIRLRAEGWFGIAKIQLPFDSSSLFLTADYYGGGTATLIPLCDGISEEGAKQEIMYGIMTCLDNIEETGYEKDTVILVESTERLNLPCSIGMHLGVKLQVAPKELEVLLGDNKPEACDLLREFIAKNRFAVYGDSYIPSEVVTDLNKKLGTNYNDKVDVSFSL